MVTSSKFSAREHIPRYSRLLLESLQTPLLIFFALAGNLVTFAAAALFYFVESGLNPKVESYFDAIWWAFCTVSTVGYGDVTPITNIGRVTGMVLMVTGILFFVGFTAVLVSVISTRTAREILEGTEEEMSHELSPILIELRKLREEINSIKSKL